MATDAQLASDLTRRSIAGVGAPAATRRRSATRLDRPAELPQVHGLLARAFNSDVLPRMVLSHRGQTGAVADAPATVAGVAAGEVEQLADIALLQDTPATLSFVERKRADGLALDAVHLDLMAPAARLLGTRWEDDLVDFGQVTIATNRLRQVMRSFGLAHQGAACLRQATHRALLVPGPGDQHSFGLAMVADFFARAGWHVWSGVPDSNDQVLQMAQRDWYGIVGFSVGSVIRLDALSQLIRKLRRMSCNHRIGVMVGGPVFHQSPELVAAVGADATASDGRDAVRQAHRLLDLASQHV